MITTLNLTQPQCVCPNLNPTVGTFITGLGNQTNSYFTVLENYIRINTTATYNISAHITFEGELGGTRAIRIARQTSSPINLPLQGSNLLLGLTNTDAINNNAITLSTNTNNIQLNSGEEIRFAATQSSTRGLIINPITTNVSQHGVIQIRVL